MKGSLKVIGKILLVATIGVVVFLAGNALVVARLGEIAPWYMLYLLPVIPCVAFVLVAAVVMFSVEEAE